MSAGLDLSDVQLGDSIANNGVCLTVIAHAGNTVQFDVSRETLNCTVGLAEPGEVDLERRCASPTASAATWSAAAWTASASCSSSPSASHELVIRAPRRWPATSPRRARSPSTASASPSIGSRAATSRST